jgi:quercetin dioxygenase-like cupin family protein
METRSEREASYFPREALILQPDVAGARMWGVALDKAVLTYFEVEPHCRFERHHHESEQITMVLEGELFFELDGATFCVRQGDVIAIPSDVPHAVFTQDTHVKAVDAWSPVMQQFLRPKEQRGAS